MPNDAKLGLVVGIGLVIAVAVMYFRKDVVTADSAEAAASANGAAVKPKPATKAPGHGQKPVKARPTAHVTSSGDSENETDDSEVDHQQLPTPNVLQLPGSSEPADQPAEQERNDTDKGQ